MVTRKVAMDTMIQSAHEKGTQFIFLSPLHFDQDFDQTLVRVIRMADPKRTTDKK